METDPLASLFAISLLLPATGIAVASFVWLVSQFVTPRRAGWIAAVLVPVTLFVYTFLAYAGPLRFAWGSGARGKFALLGLVVAAIAGGYFLDRGSSVRMTDGALSAQRTSWPLVIWGAGVLLPVVQASAYAVGVAEAPLEHGKLADALALVGACALLGQAGIWGWRLRQAQAAHHSKRKISVACEEDSADEAKLKRQRGGTATVAALIIGLFVLPEEPFGVSPDSGPPGGAAPLNLLIGTEAVHGGGLSNGRIFTRDTDSGRTRILPAEGFRVRWSPDRTMFAFCRREGDAIDIWIAAADGSSPLQLTDLGGFVTELEWAIDSREIYFVYGESWAQGGLWKVAIDGGAPEEILPKTESVGSLSVSPDGTALVYLRGTDFSQAFATPDEVTILDLRSDKRLKVRGIEGNVGGIAWTRDGKSLIVAKIQALPNGGSGSQLEVVRIADGERRLLGTMIPRYVRQITYSPRGELVLIGWAGSDQPHNHRVWIVDPATGQRSVFDFSGSPTPFSLDWVSSFHTGAVAALPRGGARSRADTSPPAVATAPAEGQVVPDSPESRAASYNDRGVEHFKNGRWSEAESMFLIAKELDPNNAEYHSRLGVVLFRQKKWAEAESVFRKAIQLKPDHALYHNHLGHALRKQKRWAEAEAACREAIRLDPTEPGLLNDIGVLFVDQRKWVEAEQAFRQAVQLDPDSGSVLANLAGALFASGRRNEALTAAQKAIRLGVADHWVFEDLGLSPDPNP